MCFMSTMIKQPLEVQRRVALVPIGVGAREYQTTIHSAPSNRGNSVVGKAIKDFQTQFLTSKDIYVARLDSVVKDDDDVIIPVMKMDVQGLECHAIAGMGRVLQQRVQVPM